MITMIYYVDIDFYKLEWFKKCPRVYVIFPLTVKMYIKSANVL